MALGYFQSTPTHWESSHVFLRLRDPLRWLARGGRDLLATPGISLFYGCCFWLMAIVLGAVFRSKPEYVISIASGCLLVGPFLAMGAVTWIFGGWHLWAWYLDFLGPLWQP